MTLFASLLIFIFGSIIGSFLSVILFRLNKKPKRGSGSANIISGRSICPYCKKKLKFRHLVPIFSWLFLGGRCGYCREKISVSYLALELLTALTFLALFLNNNFVIPIDQTITATTVQYFIDWQIFQTLIFQMIIFSFLIAIFFFDLIHGEIPDQLSIPAIIIAIIGNLGFGLVDGPSLLKGALIIGGFFAIQFILSKGKWVGGGDIRLGALIGAFLGFRYGLIALILSYFIGTIISVFILMSGKISRKSQIPFAPFLVAASYLSFFFGSEINNWYFSISE